MMLQIMQNAWQDVS